MAQRQRFAATGGLARLSRFAGPLMRLESPQRPAEGEAGPLVPMGGIPVLVRFPENGRAQPDTFRCLLNGNDVTHLLTVGSNGVAGTVYPLREGRNRLRFEVFGKPLWGGRFYRDSMELPISARPLALDRA